MSTVLDDAAAASLLLSEVAVSLRPFSSYVQVKSYHYYYYYYYYFRLLDR